MNKHRYALLQDLSEPALSTAIEANFAEEMACFGRYLPGAEFHEDPEFLWFHHGQRFNGVLLTNISSPASIDAKIEAMCDQFRVRDVQTMAWSVGPSTRPTNLAAYLEAHDFQHLLTTTGMAIDLLTLNSKVPVPGGLTIAEVTDMETLTALRDLEMQGFGASREVAEEYYTVYVRSGIGKDAPWHHYIGWLNSEPVAMASLLLYAGIAGIYGVATIPQVRRQGIGAAMTMHALHAARAMGYHVASLSPTEMSLGIYQRLGFQKYCEVVLYKRTLLS